MNSWTPVRPSSRVRRISAPCLALAASWLSAAPGLAQPPPTPETPPSSAPDAPPPPARAEPEPIATPPDPEQNDTPPVAGEPAPSSPPSSAESASAPRDEPARDAPAGPPAGPTPSPPPTAPSPSPVETGSESNYIKQRLLAPSPGAVGTLAPSPALTEAAPEKKKSTGSTWRDRSCLPRVIYGWREGQGIPPGYERRKRYRERFIYGGAAVFGASWVVTSVAAGMNYHDDPSGSRLALAIPVAGPFIEGFGHERGQSGLLFYSASFQIAGLVGLVWGLVDHKTVLVRTYEDTRADASSSWSVAPVIAPGQAGLGFRGDF